jgi:hypothetical protein
MGRPIGKAEFGWMFATISSWQHPQYRRGFTSADVYAAVLDRGVRGVPGFWADLRETKGIAEPPA